MPLPQPVTRIVLWAQSLLAPVLQPGALAVDLTAGSGRDTLFLFEQVGPRGRVVAFDIQPAALQQTAHRLTAAGAVVHRHAQIPGCSPLPPGVHLLPVGHEQLSTVLSEAPAAIIANLGYLPGGDPDRITGSDSTLAALTQSCSLLASGGRLAVVAYPGHPGGDDEAVVVEAFFRALPAATWQTLRLGVPNREAVPLLLLAERR